jgi:ATP adenylyltransferase
VTSAASAPGCVLCRSLESASEPRSLVVHVAPLSFVMMNLYPYNAGHLMVSPKRHVASLGDATREELLEMMALAQRLEAVLGEVYRPQGINLGMNLGKPAGAGVAEHIHLHLVPRWIGDTNFMTVVGETRVIPEDPAVACSKLRPYFAAE